MHAKCNNYCPLLTIRIHISCGNIVRVVLSWTADIRNILILFRLHYCIMNSKGVFKGGGGGWVQPGGSNSPEIFRFFLSEGKEVERKKYERGGGGGG